MRHTVRCASDHVPTAIVGGAVFSALHVAQGARPTPQLAASNIGFLYAYGALICPMEDIQGRRSSVHNFLSGSILGYIGIVRGHIGVPFNLEAPMLVNRVPLPVGGALVYGSLAYLIASFQGKSL
jgi:hypothetical protein